MERFGVQGQSSHTHDRDANRSSETEDKGGGRACPPYAGGTPAEAQDGEGVGGLRELHSGGRRHRSPLFDGRNSDGLLGIVTEDPQNSGSSSRNQIQDKDCLERARLDSLERADILLEASAFGNGQLWQHERNEPRHGVDSASGDHREVLLDAHSQQRPGRGRDLSIDRLHRSPDDFSKVYRQSKRRGDETISDTRGICDVSSDGRQRRYDAADINGQTRERDVHTASNDRSRKRGDVDGRKRWAEDDDTQRRWDGDCDNNRRRWGDGDDVRRRRDDDDDRRRRDVDATWDIYNRHNATSDKGSKNQSVDDVRGGSQRRRDAEDALGHDGHRWRHNADGVTDRRRQDRDDAFENRRASGGFDHRSRSPPHRRQSHNDKRHSENDGGGDRFSARFRDAERNEDKLPELFSVHRAKVQSVRPFGVFVRIEGFHKQGLVHLSQLSDHEVTEREDSDEMKVRAVAAVAGEGDQVWVKVISLKDDGGGVKIGCSLKLVSQSTGKDLDPNNLKLEQQQPKGNRQDPKKVTLDAIYNVVCSRCGGHGHLKTECYAMADKSYELLPEEDDPTEELPQPSQSRIPVGVAGLKPGYGRGRAMVLPAWMTHGSIAKASQHLGSDEPDRKEKKRKALELPDKITTVEEAKALIAQVKKAKKDKHHRKEHRKHKDRKAKKSSKKEKSSRKDRVRD